MGSSTSIPIPKKVTLPKIKKKVLDAQKQSKMISNGQESYGELESIISHMKEKENRKFNHLTPCTLKNFGIVLAKGRNKYRPMKIY